VEWHADSGQVIRQYLLRESRLLLIQIHRQNVELHRCALAQFQKDIQQRVGILAARQAHHHPVAGFDHVEILDGLARQAAQALFQLVAVHRMFQWFGLHEITLQGRWIIRPF